MSRPRLLDLFCGAGGCTKGYQSAGFYVVGVDIARQPRYCGDEFIQADALTFPLDGFQAVHGSPPCQRFSVTRHSHSKDYADLLTPTLARFGDLDVPWVVENVPGAPVPNRVELCGASFRLTAPDTDGTPLVLRRHRLFGSNLLIMVPSCQCAHYRRAGTRVGGVYGHGPENRRAANRNLGRFRGGYVPTGPVRARLMGIDWMTQRELTQAIPPVYTEHIGRQLLAALG